MFQNESSHKPFQTMKMSLTCMKMNMYGWFRIKTLFETEVKGDWEMAICSCAFLRIWPKLHTSPLCFDWLIRS